MSKTYKQESFEFSFKLQESDLFWANLRLTYSRLPFKISIGLGLFSLGMFGLSFLDTYAGWNRLGVLILPLFIFVLLPYSILSNTRKAYREVRLYSEKQTFTFDSKGVHIHGHSFSRNFEWSDFTKHKKYKSIILIWFGQYQVFVIPLGGLTNETIRKLEDVMSSHDSVTLKS